jgi:chromosomal replication initiator protein
MIARKFQSNIRELEGALIRIAAYSDLRGLPLTADVTNAALADMLPQRNEVKPEEIINTVASAYGLSTERMLGRDRSRQVAFPRQIAMFLLREESKISLPQIGDALGGRDHTTVMYGCEKIADLLERDDKTRREVIKIKEKLYGHTV